MHITMTAGVFEAEERQLQAVWTSVFFHTHKLDAVHISVSVLSLSLSLSLASKWLLDRPGLGTLPDILRFLMETLFSI